MTEALEAPRRTPGVVIFVAILNFVGAAIFLFFTVFLAVVVPTILGVYKAILDKATAEANQAIAGLPGAAFPPILNFYQFWMEKLSQYGAEAAAPLLALKLFLGIGILVSMFFVALNFAVGIGLLRGVKFFWYLQIVLSVLGLLSFPLGTAINALILIFFFQSNVRSFFKV